MPSFPQQHTTSAHLFGSVRPAGEANKDSVCCCRTSKTYVAASLPEGLCHQAEPWLQGPGQGSRKQAALDGPLVDQQQPWHLSTRIWGQGGVQCTFAGF